MVSDPNRCPHCGDFRDLHDASGCTVAGCLCGAAPDEAGDASDDMERTHEMEYIGDPYPEVADD